MSKKKQSTKNTIKSEREVVVETRLLSSKMVRALEDFCETHKIKIPQHDHEFNLLNFLVLITDKANKLNKAAKDVDEAIQKLMSISKNLDEDGVMDYAQECPNCGSDVLIEYSECHVCGENLFTSDVIPLSNDDLKFKEEMLKKPVSEPKKSDYIEHETVEMDLDNDDDFFEEEEPKKEEPKKKVEPKKEEKPKKASKKVDIEEEEDEDDFFNDFDDEDEDEPAPKKSSKKEVVEEDDFDDFDDEEEEKPAPKKSSKKEVVEVEEDEDEDEDDAEWEDMLSGFDDDEDEDEDEPAPKKSSKKKVVEEEEEDFEDEDEDDFSFDDEDDSDDEEEEKPAPKSYKPKAVIGDEDDEVLVPNKKKVLTEEEKTKKLNDLLSKIKKNPKVLNELKRTDLTFIGLKLKFNGTLKMKKEELHTAILKHISGK